MATFADCRSTPRPLSTNNSFHVNAIHNKKSSRPPLLIVNEVNVFEPKKNRRHKGHYRHSWEHPDRHLNYQDFTASDIDVTPLDGLIKMFSISLYPRVFISLHKELLSCDPSTYDEDDILRSYRLTFNLSTNFDYPCLKSN
ncbi:hypothetical protein BLNAU_4211 [Blattamonas nauphoetae]|uniref:Uncharacterized protein n=1 Tax=Blattamonas nauphoetae TaxID=2049346 RepID=A0ABQ9YB27_9EUKA|nr:hypothetical protein BLNAU_4211 [Blattamonas nauphoetae]